MSVRIRILVTLVLVAAIYAPIMLVLRRALFIPRFVQLDEDAAQRDVERVVQTLARETEHLGLLCADWGQWDDTYDYVVTRDAAYLKTNLGFETFESAHLDLIGLCDTSGDNIWAQLWDMGNLSLICGDGAEGEWPALSNIVTQLPAGVPHSGLADIGHGLMLVAIHPIVQSDGEGEPRGVVVMGRFADDDFFATVAESTRVDVQIIEPTVTVAPTMKVREVALDDEWPGCVVTTTQPKDGAVVSYAVLPGLDGVPIVGVMATSLATVMAEGQRAIAAVSLAVMLLVALSAITTAIILERLVGRRVARLSAEVEGVSLNGERVSWMTVAGNDEITRLAKSVNRTVFALQEATLVLRASQTRMAALFNSSAVGSAILDADGRYVYVSERWADMLGRSAKDIERRPVGEFAHPEDADSIAATYRAIIAGMQDDTRSERRYVKADGSLLWVDCAMSAIRASGGELEAAIVVYVDVNDRRNAEDQLRQLSLHDALTGLPNRRAFDDHLDREWRIAMRLERPLSLLMVDIDDFKAYNDAYGHQPGDECLQQVASVMMQVLLRATDFACRWGGEEFAVIISGANAAGGADMGERLRQCVADAKLPRPGLDPDHVTISVGVATLKPPPGADLQEFVGAADRALYISKTTGRDKCSVVEL